MRYFIKLKEGLNMECPECGKIFQPTKTKKQFCSQRCAAITAAKKMAINKKTGQNITCKTCGKEIYVPLALLGRKTHCSKECMHKDSHLFEFNKTKRNGFIKQCLVCGKDFYVPLARKNAKYCSDECRIKRLNVTEKKKCIVCGKNFATTYHNKKYCSRECGRRGQKFLPRKDRRRENQRLVAFMSACQKCGYKEYLCILGVHHIDKNPHNNEPDNLIVLCPNCHSIEHSVHVTNNGHK